MSSKTPFPGDNPTQNLPMPQAAISQTGSQSGFLGPRSANPTTNMSPRTTQNAIGMSYNKPMPPQSHHHYNSISYSMQTGSNLQHNQLPGLPGSFRPGNESPRLSFHRENFNNNVNNPQLNPLSLGNQLAQHSLQTQTSQHSNQPQQNHTNLVIGASNQYGGNNTNGQFANSTPPHFSSKMSVSGMSMTGSVRGGALSNNQFQQSLLGQQQPYPSFLSNQTQHSTFSQNSNPQQQQPNNKSNSPLQQDTLPVIVPVQQELVVQDPIFQPNEQALESRVLMRTHYRATGLCILFVFSLFLLLIPVTYWMAWSTYKSEIKSFTKEQCSIDTIEKVQFTVQTPCGQSTGYRFNIQVVYNGRPNPLCSAEPYACYNATSIPEPDDGDDDDDGNTQKFNRLFLANFDGDKNFTHTNSSFNYQQLYEQTTHPLAFTTPSSNQMTLFNPQSTSSFISSQNDDDSPFECTLCLRNDISQCFSPISAHEDAFDDLVPGTVIPCWEYTIAEDSKDKLSNTDPTSLQNRHLTYRYFMGSPKELEGYPYIHSWYIFFIFAGCAFLLIAIYYLVKGVGICDIIDPSYWQRKRDAAAKIEFQQRQVEAKEEYLKKQTTILNNQNGQKPVTMNEQLDSNLLGNAPVSSARGSKSTTKKHRSKNDQSNNESDLASLDTLSINNSEAAINHGDEYIPPNLLSGDQ